MSWQAASWASAARTGDPVLKGLLIALANYANDENETWHSQRKIAFDTEIPERTLRRKLDELQSLGLIEITPRIRDDGTKTTNMIRLLIDPAATVADGDDQRPKTGGTSGQKQGAPAATKVAGQDSKRTKKNSNSISYSEEFENRVWQPYPRKNGTSKKNASRNYERLSADDQAMLIAAIPRYAQMVLGKDEQHMKHLEFFISGRVFETIHPPTRSGPPRPGEVRPEMSRDTWEKLLKIYKSTSNWKPQWGPEPGKSGCLAPADLIETILGDKAA